MLTSLIFLYQFFILANKLEISCKQEKIIYQDCFSTSKPAKEEENLLLTIQNKKDSKSCYYYSGYIDITCKNGKWKINESKSICKTECSCCY